MKKWLFLLLVLPIYGFSQNMNNDTLHEIYTTVSDSIQGNNGAWQFFIREVPIMSITDTNHNRMRIISPIADSGSLTDDLIKAALVANFHTALDVKYAVSDGVIWSVFIHPLKELSDEQVKDAVSQVYYANVNFGTTFASTGLTFPSRLNKKEPEIKENKKTEFKKL
ncbi:hypothetical protein [Flavivirga eckloniae]|uniref:Uncharacterized protein n=1 Tax=Flavivirga eckloniae TaxID=1803846 RepID=A0A2K9PQT8_9FLAO|nr:hypothetical protein [Flavivirga eckloniae]AUP79432.1 hypothetical protein C1H87_12230 [Flavivirga eckloniae]